MNSMGMEVVFRKLVGTWVCLDLALGVQMELSMNFQRNPTFGRKMDLWSLRRFKNMDLTTQGNGTVEQCERMHR